MYITCQATFVSCEFNWALIPRQNLSSKKNSILKKQHAHTHAKFCKNWLCPNFSCRPKNLSCPNFGGKWGTVALAPRPHGPMVNKDSFKNILRGFSQNITSFSFEASIAMKDGNFVRFRVLLPYTNVSSLSWNSYASMNFIFLIWNSIYF